MPSGTRAPGARSGRRPFDGESAGEIADAISRQQIWPVPAAIRLPPRVHAALVRGLRAEPGQRHPSIDALLDALSARHSRRRRVAIAGLLAAITIGVVWAHTADEPADRCASLAGWDGIWDATRRAEIERAFLATGVSYAGPAYRQLQVALDHYTTEWSARARQVCLVAAVDDTPDARAELACLQRRRDDVVLLADSVAHASPPLVPVAPRLALGLRPWVQCQVDPESAGGRRPAAESAAITQLQMDLAAAVLVHKRAELASAERMARGVIARVGELDIALLTEARLLLGGVLQDLEREDEDETAFFAAATGAEAAGLYALAAEGWLALAAAARGRPNRDPDRWLALAEIAVERAGNQSWLAASLASHRAMQSLHQGEVAGAIELQRQAAATLAAQFGAGDLRVIESNYRLGSSLGRVGECGEAEPLLRAAVEARSRLLSPRHPDTLDALEALGICVKLLGRPAEAVRLFTDALRGKEAELGRDAPGLARPLDNLAGALHELKRDEEALELLRRSVALRAGAGKDVRRARPLANLGTVLLRLDRPAEALSPLRQARDLFQDSGGRGDLADAGFARLQIATALLRLARPRAAISELAPFEGEPSAPFAGSALVVRGRALLGLGDRAAGARVLGKAASHAERRSWSAETEQLLVDGLARVGK